MYHFIQLSTMQRPEGARKYVPMEVQEYVNFILLAGVTNASVRSTRISPYQQYVMQISKNLNMANRRVGRAFGHLGI